MELAKLAWDVENALFPERVNPLRFPPVLAPILAPYRGFLGDAYGSGPVGLYMGGLSGEPGSFPHSSDRTSVAMMGGSAYSEGLSARSANSTGSFIGSYGGMGSESGSYGGGGGGGGGSRGGGSGDGSYHGNFGAPQLHSRPSGSSGPQGYPSVGQGFGFPPANGPSDQGQYRPRETEAPPYGFQQGITPGHAPVGAPSLGAYGGPPPYGLPPQQGPMLAKGPPFGSQGRTGEQPNMYGGEQRPQGQSSSFSYGQAMMHNPNGMPNDGRRR